MRLLVHLYFPLLSRHQAGGAQFALREILFRLAEKGFDITVICPITDSDDVLSTDHIKTYPVLKEKERKPLNLHERIHNVRQLSAFIENVDAIWTFDASFPIRVNQPIVLTLQTIAYEDELNSLLDLNWDLLIVPSQYLGNIANAVVGRSYWTGSAPSIVVIPNGIDTNVFIPSDTAEIRRRLNFPSGNFILFPHRPEPEKGFDLAFKVIQRLKKLGADYKLLVPMNPSSVRYCLEKEKKYYRYLVKKSQQLGVDSSIIFHPWICLEDLPAYYSLGSWCLVLSILPEGFGFVPVQSIACGTPVICSKSGSLRERFPPNHGVFYIDAYNDSTAVDEIVSHILNNSNRGEISLGQAYLKQHYSIDLCAEMYAQQFLTVSKRNGDFSLHRTADLLQFSPWCYLIDQRTVWNDLTMKRIRLTREQADLIAIVMKGEISYNTISNQDDIKNLLENGILFLGEKGN